MSTTLECVLIVLLGGFVNAGIRTAPAISPGFKTWATWITALGVGIGVLARLGLLSRLGGDLP